MNYVLIYLIVTIVSMVLTFPLFYKMITKHCDQCSDEYCNENDDDCINTTLTFFLLNAVWPLFVSCLIILYSFYFFSKMKTKKAKGEMNVEENNE